MTAGVMACKATRKLDDVLDAHTIRLEQARKDADTEKNSVAKAYLATGAALARLYGPSIAVGALSMTNWSDIKRLDNLKPNAKNMKACGIFE